MRILVIKDRGEGVAVCCPWADGGALCGWCGTW